MEVNETVNFSGTIIANSEGLEPVSVAYLSSNIDNNSKNFNINVSVINKELLKKYNYRRRTIC